MWFGDERGYNATCRSKGKDIDALWFGDERGYNATETIEAVGRLSCGLVMKEDITQLSRTETHKDYVVVW